MPACAKPLALLLLLLFSAAGLYGQNPPQAESPLAGRDADLSFVFHTTKGAAALRQLEAPLLLTSQTLSVLFIVGGLLLRLQRNEALMENLASMMLRVGFIASLALWRNLCVDTADLLIRHAGSQALPGASLSLEQPVDARVSSTLLSGWHELEQQWSLGSSPVQDSLEEQRPFVPGDEEPWLARSWNWAKANPQEAALNAPQGWAIAAGSQRAASLHQTLWLVGFCVQATRIAWYLGEWLRLLLFHGGFLLLPLLIAGLGDSPENDSMRRGLQTLLCLALCPLAWSLCNVATLSMLQGAVEMIRMHSSSALYPNEGPHANSTLALAAPWISWSLLSYLSSMTLALCLWVCSSLVLMPWALLRLARA
jgi:hypothetical protein